MNYIIKKHITLIRQILINNICLFYVLYVFFKKAILVGASFRRLDERKGNIFFLNGFPVNLPLI